MLTEMQDWMLTVSLTYFGVANGHQYVVIISGIVNMVLKPFVKNWVTLLVLIKENILNTAKMQSKLVFVGPEKL